MRSSYDAWLDKDLPDCLPEPSDGEYFAVIQNENVVFEIKDGVVDSVRMIRDLNRTEVIGLLSEDVIDSLYDSACEDCLNQDNSDY
jgi:hypothetical protein